MIIGNFQLAKAFSLPGDTEIVFVVHRPTEGQLCYSVYQTYGFILFSLDEMNAPCDWSPRWQDSIDVPGWAHKVGDLQVGDAVIYALTKNRSGETVTTQKYEMWPVTQRRLLLTAEADVFAGKLPYFKPSVFGPWTLM